MSCSVLVYGHLFHSLMTAVVGQVLILSAMCFSQRHSIPSSRRLIGGQHRRDALDETERCRAARAGSWCRASLGSPERRRAVLILLAGAAGAGVLLLSSHINPFDVIRSYLGVSGRAKPDKLFVELDAWDRVGVSGQLVVALIPVIFSSGLRQTSGKAGNRTFVGICWVAFFVGLYSMTTNWDIKLGDLTYWILAITAYPLLTKSHRFAARAASAWCLFVFLGVGIAYGVCRTRNRHVGYGTFFEWKTLSHPVPIPFFRDLNCRTQPSPSRPGVHGRRQPPPGQVRFLRTMHGIPLRRLENRASAGTSHLVASGVVLPPRPGAGD